MALSVFAVSLSAAVPRTQCFPVETLPASERPIAEKLLLMALDGDALFTVITGLKPMTTAYAQRFNPPSSSGLATHFRVKPGELDQLKQLQIVQSALHCGDDITTGAAVMPVLPEHAAPAPATHVVWPYIVNRPALRAMLRQRQDLYRNYGITDYTDPTALLLMIGSAPKPDRDRMFGHLFGYPEYAVEWYAQHGQPKSPDGEPLFSDIRIEAYDKGTAFEWTTPKEHVENEQDKDLRQRANAILAEYKRRREKYVGAGKPGIVELLRDWFDDGRGHCSAKNADVPGL